MNLPFSPTFFRKMDIFQQLMEYENQKEKKLWEGEKVVLFWGGSDQHQHLGSLIDVHHVKDALVYCVQQHIIPESENVRLRNNARHIVDSLPVHGFATVEDVSNPRNQQIKINKNGILAGQILMETNFLKNTWKYQIWTSIWWLILIAAGLILLSQSVSAAKSLFFSDSDNHTKSNHPYYRIMQRR